MTDSELFERLSGILTQLNEKEYPDICSQIRENLDEENHIALDDAFSIACQLHDADGTKQIPKGVADFLFEVYEGEMEIGNADAACNLGSLYYTGRAGEQNYAKALEYYAIAAKGGSRQAQENLGYCYYYGRDTEVDYEKAFHYFALGAFDGHLRSLYKIGDMYLNGYHVEKHEQEAFRIYCRCAEIMTEDDIPLVGADVMMRLGDCYFSGLGTEVNYKNALKHYQLAEQLFLDRLETGDYMIKDYYCQAITRQAEIREYLEASLPAFDWAK